MPTLRLDLIVRDSGSAVMKKFGSTAEREMAVAKKAAVGFGVAFAAGVAAVAVGGAKLKGVLQESIALANIQEREEEKLAAVLRATGHAAGFSAEELIKQAAALQLVTDAGDETIIAGQAILATFKNISGNVFQRTIAVGLDMAEVLNTDLKSAMIQFGKAINDPITGLSMLTRVGITFTEEQKELIKGLQESGDLVAAQGVILEELESQFGGAAEAIANTFGGAVKQAGNDLGDMKEEIGFVITKNTFFIELVKIASEQFRKWSDDIEENRDHLSSLAKDGILLVIESIGGAIEVIRFFSNVWDGLKLVSILAIEDMVIAIDFLAGGLRLLLHPLDMIFEGLVKLGAIEVNPFDALGESFNQFRADISGFREEVGESIEATNQKFDNMRSFVDGVTESIRQIPLAAAEAAESIGPIAGAAGITDVGGEEFTEKQKEAFAKDLEAVEEHLATKEELFQAATEQRIEAILLAQEAHLITDIEAKKLLEKLEKDHQDELNKIREKGMTDAQKFQAKSYKDQAIFIIGQLEQITAAGARENRTLFAIHKAAAIAMAIINTAQGITSALALGPLGIPLAAVIAAAGAVQVATILGTSFEGGGAVAHPPTGVTATTPVTPAESISEGLEERVRPSVSISITVDGTVTDEESFARSIAPYIRDAVAEGAAAT